MFLAEFVEEYPCQRLCSRREESGMERAGCSIDGGVQLISLVVALDHSLVYRTVIGSAPSSGCKSAFCAQLWTIGR